MDFTTYFASHQLLGVQDGASEMCEADLYLLDGAYTVLSARTHDKNVPLGTCFFEHFPANRPAREELAQYLSSFPHEILLLRCGRIPVFFVGTFFAHTGLLLAIIPRNTLQKIFAFPAAFHHVPASLFVSRTGQMYHKEHTPEDFAAACRFYTAVTSPFTYHNQQQDAPILPVLIYRAVHLARLCGLQLTYDLSGLRVPCGDKIDLDFCTGVLLATMMAGQHQTAGKALQIEGAYEGAPMLFLHLRCEEEGRVLHPVIACAEARGRILDVVRPQDAPDILQLRVQISVAELSVQGVREKHPFLEGESPISTLPHSHVITPDFPELSFD